MMMVMVGVGVGVKEMVTPMTSVMNRILSLTGLTHGNDGVSDRWRAEVGSLEASLAPYNIQ
jgi:hypothetical protein